MKWQKKQDKKESLYSLYWRSLSTPVTVTFYCNACSPAAVAEICVNSA